MAQHINSIQRQPGFSDSRFIIYVERNLGFEAGKRVVFGHQLLYSALEVRVFHQLVHFAPHAITVKSPRRHGLRKRVGIS